MPTNSQKWIISSWSVLLVLLIFNPVTYYITNLLFGFLGTSTIKVNKGPITFSAPTIFGFGLHLLVLVVLTRLMMDFKLPGY
jgi:hypothetical protein